jgi:hypothetical protein
VRLSWDGRGRRLRATRGGVFSVALKARATARVSPIVVTAAGQTGPFRLAILRAGSGVLLGVYVNSDAVQGQSRAEVSEFEAKIGRTLAIGHHYREWGSSFDLDRPNVADEAWDVANGRIPMISHGDGGWNSPINLLDAINSGSQDALIQSQARQVRAFGHRLFYRLFWEMNGDWETYNETNASTPGTHDGTAKFVAAWRRIHSIYRQEGATNALFVWCPNHSDWPATPSNHWTRYYPGDAYTDWVCADGFNRGQPWHHFRHLFTPSVYEDYPQKPFMVGETASVEDGGSKAAWIRDAREYMKTQMPNLKAFVWFHRGPSMTQTLFDWRVDTSPSALAAFRAMAQDPYFQAR